MAVEITSRPVQVRPLTGSSAATRELAATVQNLITRHAARYFVGGGPFDVPGQRARTAGPGRAGPGCGRWPG